MNFRDRQLVCSTCGRPFIYTVTEQRQRYSAAGGDGETRVDMIVAPSQCPVCRLRDPETGRWTGQIKWYSYEKGYGFIVKPDGDEVFFHRTQVADDQAATLEEGAAVTFEQVDTDRGPEAQEVRVEGS